MVKIIGVKEEVDPILDAIRTDDTGLVTYEYIDNQPKNTFQVQCVSADNKYSDYQVKVEYIDGE